jgi:hypothetical protein
MIAFIETAVFSRTREAYLDDREFAELQQFLVRHPEAGNVVPGSGGVRKLRWTLPARGKRGLQENIAPETLRRLKEIFDGKKD